MPFGRAEQRGLIVEFTNQPAIEASRLKPVIAVQRDAPALPPDWIELVGFVARYYHAPIGEVVSLALPPGLRRADSLSPQEADPLLRLTALGQAALGANHRARRSLAVAELLSAHTALRYSALQALGASSAALLDARRRGWIEAASGAPAHSSADAPALTEEQAGVLAGLAAAGEGFRPVLLHGVTGSGKTEIYLRLARDTLAQGRQVLMLVPEIALTPQLESRVQRRFAQACVVSLHSAQSDGARSSGFALALEGRADIVLGTRLAVFTPLPRLGLIIVDEEHDPSYAQLEGVRYSARDVAVWRARQRQVPVLLGSATPSLESWHHAGEGRYAHVELTRRALAAALPKVRRIDTRRLKLDEGLSPSLIEALRLRLARGEQSLVFLNRRGYAPVLSCTACGWVSACEHCSANRVVHLAEGRLRCHHCGAEAPIPRACPACGNQDIHAFGRGTQRVEERLAALFPEARVLRIDRDAVKSRGHWEELLARVAAGEADILVGTQMMAKGHDFPRLTLVGVLGADASLHAADFRAPERLFQQLMQVGGRAGRAELAGEVLVQTEFPEHPLYACLVTHDYARFARMALDERRRASFPPFAFQAMLRADAPQLEQAIAFLRSAAERAQALASPEIRIYDPVPMRMTRLARRERGQLLIESGRRPALQAFLGAWVAALYREPTTRELRWRIDVDPQEV